MQFSRIAATAACIFAPVSAVYQGFNYGATKSDGVTVRVQSDYESLFSTAKGLDGTNSDFTSARLYTMIQGGTANSPIEAIPAAIAQGTSLLLGIWASGGQTQVDNEIAALKAAISTYGTKFTSLVAGISVGSEDLYRDSSTGQLADAGIGAGPAVISSYISQVKSAISGTSLSSTPIGHVDTWTAWVNGTNTAVINACDFIGFDAYPYFQNTQANSIENGASLFNEALSNTKAAVGSKEIWVTESGWPVSGSTQGQAVPSVANAKTYWDAVACPLLGVTNTWWYTLEDNDIVTANPQFGVTSGKPLSTTPYYDLSCSNITTSSSTSSSASSSATGSSSASSGSSGSSVASSVAASGTAVVSSGSGLSPSGGQNGIGSASITTTAITTSAGSSSTGVAAGGNGTVSSATLKTATGSATKSSSSAAATSSGLSVGTSSGNALTGSFVGAIAGLVAAFAL